MQIFVHPQYSIYILILKNTNILYAEAPWEGIRSTGQPTSEEAAWYSRRSFGLSHDTWNLVPDLLWASWLYTGNQLVHLPCLPHMQNDGVKWSLLSLLSWLYEIMLFEWLWHKQRSQLYPLHLEAPPSLSLHLLSKFPKEQSAHTISKTTLSYHILSLSTAE